MKRIPLLLGVVVAGASVPAPIVSAQDSTVAIQVVESPLAPPEPLRFAVAERNRLSLSWEAPRPLFQTAMIDLGPFRGCSGFAVAPDGQRFLILTRRPQGSTPGCGDRELEAGRVTAVRGSGSGQEHNGS